MSTPRNPRRPWRRRSLTGAAVVGALVVASLLTLGAASGRQAAQHQSGDASAAHNAMSSTHSLSRAQGHASLVSRASRNSLSSSSPSSSSSLLPAFNPTSSAASRLLASTGCGIGGASDGSIADQTGFEDADGNLNVDKAGCTDWNSFSPTWTGTAPFQTGTATLGDLSFAGATDAINSSSDSIYIGGMKQSTNCPTATTGNVNDKADLGAIYVAGETATNGDTYLFLSWERHIDNTINSDVFVSFEFNQGKVSCGSGSPFVNRTKGDLLFEYNFQSGNSTIDVQQWDGTTWQPLPTPPFEAAVNSGTVTDTINPNQPVSLTKFEFGETGIDLTGLDLSGNGGKACETFGSVLGGSRTSKSGDTAQLKDYVGPAPLDVSNCASPTIATDATPKTGSLSSNLQDSATLSGGSTSGFDGTGTLTFYLYAPGVTCNTDGSGATYSEPGGTVSGSGPFSTTVGFGPPLVAGTYHWLAVFSGDGNNNGANSGCAAEPVVITASPSIGTTVSESTGGTGDSISDSATLSGTSNLLGTGSVTFYLYAPGATCHNDGSGTTVYQHVASSTVATNGPFASGSFGPPLVAGTYQWVAVFSGDANNATASSGCGNEPVKITASPSIGTTVSESTGGTGDSISDSATLSGTSNLLGTGSVTFYLYAPGATCHNDGSGTTVYQHVASSTVATNGPFASGSFGPPLVAGTYQWVAVFSGDANNATASSGCGNEPVKITASPSIGTTVSESTGGTGDSISDSATLSGTSNLLGTGSVTFYLYAPGATCHNDGSGTTVYQHVASSTVATNGPFASGSFGPPLVAGTYQWVAVFSGDANNATASSGCGNEPVKITASPSIGTTVSESTGGTGDSISDSATLSGTSNLLGTGSVTFYLYAPGATCHNDGSGTTVYQHVASSTVATNGPFASGSFGPPLVAGTYQWVAVFSGDANNATASSGCGNEPVKITASPSIGTTVSESTGGTGDSISDSATLSGTSNLLGTGSVTFYLYAPGATCHNDGSGTTVYQHVASSTVATNGPFASGSFGPPLVAGTYQWVAVFSGDANNATASSGCGNEPVKITASPSIGTTVSESTGGTGDSISDSATLSGTSNLLGTGSVTFYLYAPGATCHNDGSGTTVYQHVASSTVATNGPFASGSFGPPLVAGTYQWVAVFSGDANNATASSGCGNEPVKITASPSIGTTVSESTGGTGDSISDSATLSGTSNLLGTGSVTFYLYAPGATCHNDGSGTTVYQHVASSTVATNGPFASGSFGPPLVAGTYQWVAVFSGDANNATASSGCGNEPVKITASPSIGTTVSESKSGHAVTRSRIARRCGDEQPAWYGFGDLLSVRAGRDLSQRVRARPCTSCCDLDRGDQWAVRRAGRSGRRWWLAPISAWRCSRVTPTTRRQQWLRQRAGQDHGFAVDHDGSDAEDGLAW